jgi:hypothetical protein
MFCNIRLSRYGWLREEQVVVGVRAWVMMYVCAKVAIASLFVGICFRFILD